MRPGEHVRLPDRLAIGVVLRATDGGALVYVGDRTVHGYLGATAPIVAEYLDCEIVPTGRSSPGLAQWVTARLDALDVYHGRASWRALRRAG